MRVPMAQTDAACRVSACSRARPHLAQPHPARLQVRSSLGGANNPTISNHVIQKLLTNVALYPASTTGKQSGSIALPRAHDKEQRKKPDPKATPKVAEPKLPEVKPAYPDCTPKAVTLDKVRSFPGTDAHTWGFTAGVLDAGVDEVVFEDPLCKFKVQSLPSLSFDPFVYTEANKKGENYPGGTDISLEKPCIGKRFEKHVHITPEMSGRIKDAEIEHCNDHHRAFDLTYGKYITLLNSLSHGFPGRDKESCQHVLNETFKDTTGFNLGGLPDKFLCLSKKTKLRDTGDPEWHGIDLGNPTYAKDCKSADYVPDYKTAMPEVGKHPSTEIITGCGVKQ